MLISRSTAIVLNPPWNVPASIATRELWPKEKANPGYLAAQRLPRHRHRRRQQAAAAVVRTQRARQVQVRFRQPVRGLSARHARAGRVRALRPPRQPWLRPAGEARPNSPSCCCRDTPEWPRRDDRRDGRRGQDGAREARRDRSRSICSTGPPSPARTAGRLPRRSLSLGRHARRQDRGALRAPGARSPPAEENDDDQAPARPRRPAVGRAAARRLLARSPSRRRSRPTSAIAPVEATPEAPPAERAARARRASRRQRRPTPLPREEASAPDEQMMDDAAATGMTARATRGEPAPTEAVPVEQVERK